MKFDTTYGESFLLNKMSPNDMKTINEIHINKLKNNESMCGWIDYPNLVDIKAITKYVEAIKKDNQIMVVIGTGGSYLGTKAAIDMLVEPNQEKILFLGPSTDTRYLAHVLSLCEKYDVLLNVISKSGGTTEVKLYFDIMERFLKDKYHDNWYQHICCTTSTRGNLYDIAILNNYKLFFIPDNIGGRFSVLSNVGLIPMAFAGIDVEKIIKGALMAKLENSKVLCEAYKYALIRNLLYRQGFKVEMFVSYFGYFNSFIEWLKQLFGESEGKEHKGILPCSLEYPKDLHSLGQYMQDGERFVFETQFKIKSPHVVENKYIDITSFDKLRNAIVDGTAKAHHDGGVPVLIFEVDELNEFMLGHMFYFFEIACAMSAHLLGVNPFNQPGVELYKENMKDLL